MLKTCAHSDLRDRIMGMCLFFFPPPEVAGPEIQDRRSGLRILGSRITQERVHEADEKERRRSGAGARSRCAFGFSEVRGALTKSRWRNGAAWCMLAR